MADLIFAFEEILEEVRSLSRIGAEFLTAETQDIVIPAALALLESIRTARPQNPRPWLVTAERPIRTINSVGEYEFGNREGALTVFGELSFIWEISCPREAGPRSRLQKNFVLSGKSSSRIRIVAKREDEEEQVAMWRFEVGDAASPGCHFHTQIEGESLEPPFPHSLSVPRLPSILVTPMAALEFLLAELFQGRWQRHAGQETAEMQRWKPIQRNRLLKLLHWHSQHIQACIGSPWSALKAQKPPADLFARVH